MRKLRRLRMCSRVFSETGTRHEVPFFGTEAAHIQQEVQQRSGSIFFVPYKTLPKTAEDKARPLYILPQGASTCGLNSLVFEKTKDYQFGLNEISTLNSKSKLPETTAHGLFFPGLPLGKA